MAGGADRLDDQPFRFNFSSDGESRLRDKVNEKLKEFMGDYTDDTLVEYVIVLLRNGRRKDEAKNELYVFLGDDDSDSFVSWLWDHLASNLGLYVQPIEFHNDDEGKTKPTIEVVAEKDDSRHVDPESEREKSSRMFGSRHNQEWKILVRDAAEPPPCRGSEIGDIRMEDKTHRRRAKQSATPEPLIQKKRLRPNERHQTKRVAVSQATTDAQRRLLQFAVRDAVATARPAIMASEPSLKRLRSVVSTSSGDSLLIDRPQRLKSVARLPNAVATAFKAAADSAEDVKKVRSSVNVFDRLGHSTDEMEISCDRDGDYGDTKQIRVRTNSDYAQKSYDREHHAVDLMTNLKSETGLASESSSDNEGYDDVNIVGHGVMDDSQTATSHRNKGGDSLMLQYSVSKNADDAHKMWNKDQDQSAAVPSASRKIVNISVNVNTWKPPHYQASREGVEMDGQKATHESMVKSDAQVMMENNNLVVAGNGHAPPTADSQKGSQKALHSTPAPFSAGHPSEDADSRTIFVSNVHFGATKDSLSRHFNKFGEVLKVVIITDATTGQPKGAAYVEFMRKEAAEHALSLDGTSFMSRILKVVRRGAANQEVAPAMSWPRAVRGSPYAAAARFARVPFSRGIPGAFRARLPVKLGARSLQWKRDTQSSPGEAAGSLALGSTVPSPNARGLTYIRTGTKPPGNMGTT